MNYILLIALKSEIFMTLSARVTLCHTYCCLKCFPMKPQGHADLVSPSFVLFGELSSSFLFSKQIKLTFKGGGGGGTSLWKKSGVKGVIRKEVCLGILSPKSEKYLILLALIVWPIIFYSTY